MLQYGHPIIAEALIESRVTPLLASGTRGSVGSFDCTSSASNYGSFLYSAEVSKEILEDSSEPLFH